MKKRKEFTPAKRQEIQRKIVFYASVVFGISILGSVVYMGIFSDLPNIRDLEVEGNRLVGKESIIQEVEKRLSMDAWWREMLGRNHILFWPSARVEGVEETLPKLRNVEIERSVRKRKVLVRVQEEEAKGVWCAPEERCFVFNEKGKIFAEAPRVSGYLITKIMGEEGVPISVGDAVLENETWFQNIRDTIEEVERAGVQVKKAEMTSRERKEWSIETAEGIALLFGFETKPRNLTLLLGELKKEKAIAPGGTIDFRIPEKVYVR